MRLEWLEDILAVVATGSFVKAAERRHITQSAFSRRIRSIEAHVGGALFDRSRKPIEPSPVLRDRHREMIELAEGLRALTAALRHRPDEAPRRFVIAGQHAITTSIAPALVRRLVASRDLGIRLRSANREECCALLLTRQADVALLYASDRHPLDIEPSFVETRILGSDSLIPILATSHVEEFEAQMRRGDVSVVAYPRDVFLGRVLHDEIWPRLHGVTFRPTAETALTLAALQFALAGVAVAWVPETLARAQFASGTLADLRVRLGSQRLDLTAVRIRGPRREADEAVWDLIAAEGAALPRP